MEDHRKYGGDCEADIACQYQRHFDMDDDRLERIMKDFAAGTLTCQDNKKLMADRLIPIIMEHQERRKKVTDEDLKEFYSLKPMELPKSKTLRELEDMRKNYMTAWEI